MEEVQVLTAPGLNGSGPQHWQTIWEHLPGVKRIEQNNWDQPELNDWINSIEDAVSKAGPDVVIAAHSLGCLALAHWAQHTKLKIRGALLVAPPDADRTDFPLVAKSFAPAPSEPLPFRSIVVSSTNDQYATLQRQKTYANAWGSRFVNLGEAGHINAESNLGEWENGQTLVEELVRNWETL